MEEAAFFRSRIGVLKIKGDAKGISSVDLVKNKGRTTALSHPLKKCLKELDEYFKGKRKKFSVKLHLKGTPFQMKVWKRLSLIPYGRTVSYQDIARQVGNAKASRAVGMANHRNPVGIIVPCHRVIAKNGSLGGYGGGVSKKRWLLDLERRYR